MPEREDLPTFVRPYFCMHDACLRRHHARGLCGTHYRVALRSGSLPPPVRISTEPLMLLLSRLYEDSNGCWVSRTGVNGEGYARIRIDGGTIAGHRLMYERHIGPIPDGLVLDHLCRNRACCNPWHLDPVTDRVNVLRGVGRSAENAARTHCTSGHALEGPNLRMDGRRRRCRECHARNSRESRWRKEARTQK